MWGCVVSAGREHRDPHRRLQKYPVQHGIGQLVIADLVTNQKGLRLWPLRDSLTQKRKSGVGMRRWL
jgi:hypothetical protein